MTKYPEDITDKKAFDDLKKFLETGNYSYIRPTLKVEPKIGRNDTCPCGSGLKYKKCCDK